MREHADVAKARPFAASVPIRPRSRGARRSSRTFFSRARAFLPAHPSLLSIHPDTPRCHSTPTDAYQLHPDEEDDDPERVQPVVAGFRQHENLHVVMTVTYFRKYFRTSVLSRKYESTSVVQLRVCSERYLEQFLSHEVVCEDTTSSGGNVELLRGGD